MRHRFAIICILAASALSFGQAAFNPVGTWSGTFSVSPATGPDGKPLGQAPPVPKIVYKLVIKADGTFSTTTSGKEIPTSTSDGKWTRAGASITLNILRRDGKPNTEEPKKRVLTVSKDGKSMTTKQNASLTIRDDQGNPRPLPPGVKPPVITMTFTRSK